MLRVWIGKKNHIQNSTNIVHNMIRKSKWHVFKITKFSSCVSRNFGKMLNGFMYCNLRFHLLKINRRSTVYCAIV